MSKVLVLKHFHFFLFPCSLTFSFLKYEPNTSTYIHSANSSSLYKIPCKCHLLVKPSSILLGREHSPMFLQPSEHTQFLPLHPCLAPWSFYIIPFCPHNFHPSFPFPLFTEDMTYIFHRESTSLQIWFCSPPHQSASMCSRGHWPVSWWCVSLPQAEDGLHHWLSHQHSYRKIESPSSPTLIGSP